MRTTRNTSENAEKYVLQALEEEKGHYVSGSKLAKNTNVSRSAVWKVINSLRKKGHVIEGTTKKGYNLIPKDDVVSEASIKKHMHMYADIVSIRAFEKVTSTNTVARDFAERGYGQFTTIVADEQTNGKGRLGRSFFSPGGSGIYMSVILRPTLPPEKALYITTAAAAACAEAIESVFGLKTEIKWVNDVLYQGKKVCGILTESAFDAKSNVSYVVLGIGVNVFPPKAGFPKEIEGIASWLANEPLFEVRSRLIAEILERFIFYYDGILSKSFMNSYRKRLCWIGEKINVINAETVRGATLIGLSDNLELEVKFDDGERGLIYSGEVSIRKTTT